MSTCWPGRSSRSGSGLFVTLDSDWAILFMSCCQEHIRHWTVVLVYPEEKKTRFQFPYLDDSLSSYVLYLFLRVRVLWGGHLPSLALLRRASYGVFLSRSCVSEYADNKKVDGKHDDWTLNADHHLLPCKLDVTWRENSFWVEIQQRPFGETYVLRTRTELNEFRELNCSWLFLIIAELKKLAIV